MKTLKERLKDWVDFDQAEYELAVTLGMVGEFTAVSGQDPWHGTKGIFWSNNPIGEALFEMLEHLVSIQAVQKNADCKYRWNPAFVLESR